LGTTELLIKRVVIWIPAVGVPVLLRITRNKGEGDEF